MEIEVGNDLMNDLVNYGFKSFNNGNLKLPIQISENKKILNIVMGNKVPVIKFKSDNSINPVEFYVININSQEQLKIENIRLKTNYYIFDGGKYKFN